MEPAGAKRIWEHSLQKNKLRYTLFYGDGDSKSFSTIKNTCPGITIQNLECVGHVQKRVGCRLRNLRKQEKGVSGNRKLTNNMIPISIVLKLQCIFEELSNEDLLKKCLHGMTQNQNESFNAMIWSRIPKSTYVSFSQLQLGVYDAVANFNIGMKASILIFEKFNMIPGKYCLKGCRKINEKRLSASKYDNLEATKKRKKIRRGRAKTKDEKIMLKMDNLMKQVYSKT